MTNKSKKKGTRAETKLVSLLKERGIDATRQTLQGAHDVGDILVKFPTMNDFILEVKAGKQTEHYGRKLKERWLKETSAEKKNAQVGEAWLCIVVYNKAFFSAEVWSSDGHEFWYLDEFLDALEHRGYNDN